MTAPDKIADSLARLRESISFEKAGTSREERIEIMQAAAAAMANAAPDVEREIEFWFGLLPPGVNMQFGLNVGASNGKTVRCWLFNGRLTIVGAGATTSEAARTATMLALDRLFDYSNLDAFETLQSEWQLENE